MACNFWGVFTKIFVIGPPGSGKGTYSREIARKYSLCHIEPGRMLRDEMAKGSEAGKQIEPFMNSGKIPPIHITIGLIEEKLEQKNAKNGAVFDGFPRNMAQVDASGNIGLPDIVLNLIVPFEILEKKIMARQTCPECGSIYNTASIETEINGNTYCLPALLPKNPGICDNCGSVLVQRNDQTHELIKQRFAVYMEESEPLVEYYEKKNLLSNVHVTAGKDKMLEKIFHIIDSHIMEKGH